MNLQKEKNQLRQRFLNKRKELSEAVYYAKSASITARLKEQQQFQEAKTIHCYVSMNGQREVNTFPLIHGMLPDKKVIVPVTHFELGTLSHVRLCRFEDLKLNKWGVLEPGDGKEVELEALDLVIVPMVGGDLKGNRIGYGKGFYDRFLKQISCPKIGLVYESCLVGELPVESFDVPLDILITEDRVIS